MNHNDMILQFEGARPGADARALIAQLKRALEAAEENAAQLGTLRVVTTRLPHGQEPTSSVEYLGDEIRVTLGIPDGATGAPGDRGEAFRYEDFTEEQLEALRGPEGKTGPQGETGKAFTYEDFTEAQLEDLRGPAGKDGAPGKDGSNGATFTPSVGADGTLSWSNDGGLQNPKTVNIKGPRGEAFTYDDFTSEQLEELRGPQGEPGKNGGSGATFTPTVNSNGDLSWSNDKGLSNPATVNIRGPQGKAFQYEDFTQAQLEALRGPQGNAFTYEDFTPAQLEELRGPQGEPGKDGSNGATFTPRVSSSGDLSWSNDEGLSNPVTVNIRGPKGETGAGFKVLDTFVSQGALELAVPNPNPGDAYGVGLEEPYDIYIYGETKGWTNHGKLQGAQGPQGEPGKDFTYNDFTAEQLENLRGPAGKDGSEGEDGATFTPSVDSSGNLSWTNNGGLQNPTTRNIRGPAGADGANATINGENALTLEAEGPLELEQTGNTAKLRITGDVGGTTAIMAEYEPPELDAGDDWDQILTILEAPEEMFSYKVTLVGGVGYTVAAASGSTSPVPRGESFRFTVTIEDGYTAGAAFTVKANGTTLSAASGVYTISNINADQTVTVEGVVEAPRTAMLSITGTGDSSYCYATINGTKRYGAASNIEVMPGDVITFGVYGRSTSYRGTVTIDGTQALSVTNQQTQTYNWTVPDGTKTISISMSYTSSSYQRRGTITVTTTK